MNQQLVCVVTQVPGEVSVQAGSGQRGQQDDPQQHRHRAGTQSAVDQDRGVMTLTTYTTSQPVENTVWITVLLPPRNFRVLLSPPQESG